GLPRRDPRSPPRPSPRRRARHVHHPPLLHAPRRPLAPDRLRRRSLLRSPRRARAHHGSLSRPRPPSPPAARGLHRRAPRRRLHLPRPPRTASHRSRRRAVGALRAPDADSLLHVSPLDEALRMTSQKTGDRRPATGYRPRAMGVAGSPSPGARVLSPVSLTP